MERMTDYKPQERQDLEELYRKQNVRIYELEQCNLNLQEWLDNKEKVNKSLREDNKKLKEELEETKNDLEHRDSFFSIMRDVLANDDLTDEDIAEILYAVVHFECGDENLSKRNVEIAEKFWFRDYV